MVRYVGVIQRGVLSVIFVYKALSGASNRIGFRECAAFVFLGAAHSRTLRNRRPCVSEVQQECLGHKNENWKL